MASVPAVAPAAAPKPGLHEKRVRLHTISFAIFAVPTALLLYLAYTTDMRYLQAMGMAAGVPGAIAAIQLHLVIYHLQRSDVVDTLANRVAMHAQRVRQHAWWLTAGLLAIAAAWFLLAWRISPREGALLFGFLVVFSGGHGYLIDRHVSLGRKRREKMRVRDSRIPVKALKA